MRLPGSLLPPTSSMTLTALLRGSHRGDGGNDEAGLGKEEQDCVSHGFKVEGGSIAFHVRPLAFYTKNEAPSWMQN